MGKIGPVWPVLSVSAPRGAVHAPGGTAGRDRHTAGPFGRVRPGAVGGGGARGLYRTASGDSKKGP